MCRRIVKSVWDRFFPQALATVRIRPSRQRQTPRFVRNRGVWEPRRCEEEPGIGIRRPWILDRPAHPCAGAHRRSRCASRHRLSAALRPTVASKPTRAGHCQGQGGCNASTKTNAPVREEPRRWGWRAKGIGIRRPWILDRPGRPWPGAHHSYAMRWRIA